MLIINGINAFVTFVIQEGKGDIRHVFYNYRLLTLRYQI